MMPSLDCSNLNYKYRASEISVGIKTFLRPNLLSKVLESLSYYPFREIIIADDNPDYVKYDYNKVYENYSHLPLNILRLPFYTGLAAGRNYIVNSCNSGYLLLLDDDQIVNDTTFITLDVLEQDRELGGVSCLWEEFGKFKCTACNIYMQSGYIIKELRYMSAVYYTSNNNKFSYFDFIPNSTLYRVDALKEIPWDPYYKIGSEHIDFYVAHKLCGKWKFAVALDAYIKHCPQDEKNYNSYRRGDRLVESFQYFKDKFGIKDKIEGKKYLDSFKIGTFLRRLGISVELSVLLESILNKSKNKSRCILKSALAPLRQ
ncbi:MAG: hypothetical protein BRC34_06435 [Cyanobacteria bacterium QH_1_48_107]|nr:MAG: hypothetical protein BRC34_06435 [Cyanobacteria bacterium QH_1_48_107]